MAMGPKKPPSSTDVSQSGAPHGVALFDHAQIGAELAEADVPQSVVLEKHGLTEAQWNESTAYWMARIGDDVRERGADARVPLVYSDAFAQAQDGMKPVPSLDASSYAKLVVDIQKAGGPAEPLRVRALSMADYLRLSRHWARVLSTDSAQAEAFFATYEALHSEEEQV
jgi:hypothetical protein